MFTIDELLEKIDVFFPSDEDLISGYIEIEVTAVERLTKKAALISCGGEDAIWVPFSLMKCDDTKSIFVESWFYNKNF